MLHALGEILLRAVPTFLLLIFLHFYMKSVFFKPLEKVLHARYEATEGARKLAQESLARAADKAGQYESALFAAKSEIYQAQEEAFRDLQDQQSAAVAGARAAAEAEIQQARALLAADIAQAKTTLAAESDALAGRIADAILRRSAA